MTFQRLGSVAGEDRAGHLRVVSVYKDGSGYKLCGPKGSRLIGGPLSTLPAVAADEYALSNATFVPSPRAVSR